MANATALNSTAEPHPPIAGSVFLPFFAYAMLTHPGRVRHANQDACAAAPEHAAFVVCDGVGGAAGGEIASRLAVESFLNALRASAPNTGGKETDRVAHSRAVSSRVSGEKNGASDPMSCLRHAVLAANTAVYQRAQKVRTLRGMATTLVAALLEYPATSNNGQRTTDNAPTFACPTLWLAHAGDSRAYRLRLRPGATAPTLDLLTRDHSLVEEQIRAGILTRLDALRSPIRNVITRAVGSQPEVEPEIASHEILPGDLYLLASDGLTRELSDPAIARILTASLERETTASLERAAHALIDAANQHGGRDNITVLLLACR